MVYVTNLYTINPLEGVKSVHKNRTGHVFVATGNLPRAEDVYRDLSDSQGIP